jgi:DNA topoisomerase-3
MIRFTENHACRMVSLVRYFGDEEDAHELCGLCDVCAPDEVVYRYETNGNEQKAVNRILFTLYQMEETGTGSLFKTAFPDQLINRNGFEHVLGTVERAGLITLKKDSFEKDGDRIAFTKVALTFRGKEVARRTEPDIKIWVKKKPTYGQKSPFSRR